jgi:hypothetical protein
LVLTTKWNCIARKPRSFDRRRQPGLHAESMFQEYGRSPLQRKSRGSAQSNRR